MDLRWDIELDEMGACGLPPQQGDLGNDSALLIAPGEPSRSIVSLRMHALDHARMPPVGSSVIDTMGTDAIDQWIEELNSCFE